MISPALKSRSHFGVGFRARSRRGLSIIELLAAMVISLIVMGATVQLFGTVGNEIANGRTNIEMGDRVRSVVERLRKDLRGLTVDTLTWNRPESASGYLEIVKGLPQYWDQNAYKSWQPPSGTKPASLQLATVTSGATLTGYTQDMILFTTRSRDLPFVGRVPNPTNPNQPYAESQVAEVAWYLQPMKNAQGTQLFLPGNNPIYSLIRKQFLVLPGLVMQGVTSSSSGPASVPASAYYDSTGTTLYDISAHPDGNGNMVFNSLADLAYRENRFAHFSSTGPSNFPAPIIASQLTPFQNTSSTTVRYGEDVVLTNVLSFDVKVWDPWAQVRQDSKTPLVPSDPGYSGASATQIYGAYVDLNWNNGTSVTNSSAPAPYFAAGSYGLGNKQAASLVTTTVGATYDTWSAGYEAYYSGFPNSNPYNPPALNGFDDDGANGVDDPTERLTCPPYPVPLRGIQIKIRTYEFTSKQVREVTLQESFVPD